MSEIIEQDPSVQTENQADQKNPLLQKLESSQQFIAIYYENNIPVLKTSHPMNYQDVNWLLDKAKQFIFKEASITNTTLL